MIVHLAAWIKVRVKPRCLLRAGKALEEKKRTRGAASE